MLKCQCISLALYAGNDEYEHQADSSPGFQMQANPCYGEIHQGPVDNRREDGTINDHELQMMENPSYVYNSRTPTVQYHNICLHDKLDSVCAIYEKVP